MLLSATVIVSYRYYCVEKASQIQAHLSRFVLEILVKSSAASGPKANVPGKLLGNFAIFPYIN